MIFPEFKGVVWGIWDNGMDTWMHDNHGILHASEQKDIIQAQCDSINIPNRTVISCGRNFDSEYSVRVIADYSGKERPEG